MTTQKALASSVVRMPTAPVRLDQGETVHVGVDVHKATYHVALSSGTRGLLATWVQPARPRLLAAVRHRLLANRCHPRDNPPGHHT